MEFESATFSEYCRCCLSEEELQSMFERLDNEKNCIEIMSACFNIEICGEQAWICGPCLWKLTDAYDFRTQICQVLNYYEQCADVKTSLKDTSDFTNEEYLDLSDYSDKSDFANSVSEDVVETISEVEAARQGNEELLEKNERETSKTNETKNNLRSLLAMKEQLFKEILKESGSKVMRENGNRKEIPKTKEMQKDRKTLRAIKEDLLNEILNNSAYEGDENISEIVDLKWSNFHKETYENLTIRVKDLGDINSLTVHPTKMNSDILKLSKGNKERVRSDLSSLDPLWQEKVVNELTSLKRNCKDYYFFEWNRKYICVVCNKSCTDVDELKEHVRQHNLDEVEMSEIVANHTIKIDVSSMKCRHCNESVKDLVAFRRHLSSHGIQRDDLFRYTIPFNLERELNCVICKKCFPNIRTLTQHMNEHSDNYSCAECGKSFISSKQMQSHVKNIHVVGKFKCRRCNRKFESCATRKIHTLKAHGELAHLCPHCPEKLRSYRAKLVHLAEVHNEDSQKYRCQKCPKKFSTSTSLSLHNRYLHLKERNHVCSECGDRFFRKRDLTHHMVKHTGLGEHNCEVCGKSFARSTDLKKHFTRVHTDEKKYVCQVCDRGFVARYEMKSHLLTHGEKKSRK